MKTEELYQKIVEQFRRRENREAAAKKVAKFEYFGIPIRSYGLGEVEGNEIFESHHESLAKFSLKERLELAKKLYASGYSEEVGFADAVLLLSLDEITPAYYGFLDEIGEHLKNWGETDWFCSSILQPLIKKYIEETLKLLRKWNKSNQIWKQRASVVTFTRKIGESGKFTSEVLELCENLIQSKEDYVRKGIGWALKDNMRGSKKKILAYVKSLRERGITSVITLYAIRDLEEEERKQVINIKPKKN